MRTRKSPATKRHRRGVSRPRVPAATGTSPVDRSSRPRRCTARKWRTAGCRAASSSGCRSPPSGCRARSPGVASMPTLSLPAIMFQNTFQEHSSCSPQNCAVREKPSSIFLNGMTTKRQAMNSGASMSCALVLHLADAEAHAPGSEPAQPAALEGARLGALDHERGHGPRVVGEDQTTFVRRAPPAIQHVALTAASCPTARVACEPSARSSSPSAGSVTAVTSRPTEKRPLS